MCVCEHCTHTVCASGAIGGTYASPVLMPPQVAIGAIGKLQKLPRYRSDVPTSIAQATGTISVPIASTISSLLTACMTGTGAAAGTEDDIIPVHIMRLSWSADHRVVDGATMARFSNLVKTYLEDPMAMMAAMK